MNAPDIAAPTDALPQIDLNRDRREERLLVLRRSRRHAAALLAVIAAAGAALVPLTVQAVAFRHELWKTEGEAKRNKAKLQSMDSANAQLDGRINLWERLAQTQQSRRAWGATFPALAACLPQDVYLHEIQIANQDNDIEIEVQGAARSMTGLRAFANSLQESPTFAHVHLDEATVDNTEAHSGLTFRLTGPIANGAAVSAP